MKFYSIKYLTTRGIEEFEAEEYEPTSVIGAQDIRGIMYASQNSMPVQWPRFESIGKQCFRTRMEAVHAAQKMVDRKIAANAKALAKLHKLRSDLGREWADIPMPEDFYGGKETVDEYMAGITAGVKKP